MRKLTRNPDSETQPPADPLAPGTADTGGTRTLPRRTRRPPTFTSTPDIAPPELRCPVCDRPLVYRQTVISGVKPIERWHDFECQTCGAFVYRDRTRKLRPTA